MNPNRFVRRSLVAGLVLVGCVAPNLIASTAVAAPRCEAPRLSVVDRRACDKAKEGPDALRRFISRTQSIYALYFWDYMSPSDLERYYARQQMAATLRPEERP